MIVRVKQISAWEGKPSMRRGLARTAVLTFVACGLLLGIAASQRAVAASTVSLEVTFYGAPDNDPPGGVIAHPVLHQQAGGTGTWSDPVTFASDVNEYPVGTRIYYAPVRKYFIMEDDCVQCISDWQGSRHGHVDLWTGYASGVLDCEHALTPSGAAPILVRPPSNLPVDTTPIYAGGRCQSPRGFGVPDPVQPPRPSPTHSPSPSPSPSPSRSPSPSATPMVADAPTPVADDTASELSADTSRVAVLADSATSSVTDGVAWPGLVLLLLGGGALFVGHWLRRREQDQ
jgi:hypothetical protein